MALEAMIDLETWGLPPHGMIISIGAVKFDPTTREIKDRFHVAIDPETYEQFGSQFTINAGTIRWWFDHERDKARAHWLAQQKFDIGTALDAFATWYGYDGEIPIAVWGNGVTFDITLMSHAFKVLGVPPLWKFWHERCHRTLKSMVPPPDAKAAFDAGIRAAAPGVLHSALYDAEVQAHQNSLLRQTYKLVDVVRESSADR